MEVKFSAQAENMIKKLLNPEKVKEILSELAKQRQIIITGGDVIKYIITSNILEKLDTEDDSVKVELRI